MSTDNDTTAHELSNDELDQVSGGGNKHPDSSARGDQLAWPPGPTGPASVMFPPGPSVERGIIAI